MSMNSSFQVLAIEMAEQRVRARCAEERLRSIEQMLDALGITLWQTDRELRLVNSHGMVVAESYVDRHIGDFFRDAYGMQESDLEPLAAHHEAQDGKSVTLGLKHHGKRYAILVDPKLDGEGEVVGTVGMAVELT
jgi:hypothetical protein